MYSASLPLSLIPRRAYHAVSLRRKSAEDADVVTIGSVVTIAEEGTDDDESYKIVGSQEANPMEGRISDASPFGSSLLGHKIGEVVLVEAPEGVLHFTIKNIEK